MQKPCRVPLLLPLFCVFTLFLFEEPSLGKDVPSHTWFVRNDPSWVDKLSQPQYEIKFEFDLKVPMRDGVKLSANIWRPDAEGKFPVIFMCNPYDNTSRSMIKKAQCFVPRGYVFAACSTSTTFSHGRQLKFPFSRERGCTGMRA